jgi:hypothetical protein
VKPLIQEPLANIANQQVSVITLVAAPGPRRKSTARAMSFTSLLCHAHRLFRNLNKTEPAELLIFEASEKGQPLAMSAN